MLILDRVDGRKHMMSDRRTISSDVWWLVAGAAGQVGDDGARGNGDASEISPPASPHRELAERAQAGQRAESVEEPEGQGRGCAPARGGKDEVVSWPTANDLPSPE